MAITKFTDAEREQIITTFYKKHDANKTATQFKDSVAKCKADFPKMVRVLTKKYSDNPVMHSGGGRNSHRSAGGQRRHSTAVVLFPWAGVHATEVRLCGSKRRPRRGHRGQGQASRCGAGALARCARRAG